MSEKWIPETMTPLKQDIVKMPEIIRQADDIKIFDRRIKSIILTTDITIVRNTDAQAVVAVYPFTPYPAIIEGIIRTTGIPVFSGVDGGLMQDMHSTYMNLFAGAQGSMDVVLSGPTPVETIKIVDETIGTPIISTVASIHTLVDGELTIDVDVINISVGKDTAATVHYFHGKYPGLPIIVARGPIESSTHEVIIAGANTITYAPPSNDELFNKKMKKYHGQEKATNEE